MQARSQTVETPLSCPFRYLCPQDWKVSPRCGSTTNCEWRIFSWCTVSCLDTYLFAQCVDCTQCCLWDFSISYIIAIRCESIKYSTKRMQDTEDRTNFSAWKINSLETNMKDWGMNKATMIVKLALFSLFRERTVAEIPFSLSVHHFRQGSNPAPNTVLASTIFSTAPLARQLFLWVSLSSARQHSVTDHSQFSTCWRSRPAP